MEKPEKVIRQLNDEFKDLGAMSELSLSKLWLNKDDDIWDQYLDK
ncbi:MAG: hypothetical protein ABJB85_06890 [Nitrososphaerota archaeon]